ncbi:MAG: hypothetical protein FJX35_22500 [Alphaproteobacteria bacterium]|nr:hypothetical protein [Alphaproteobacteria bacterium]
MAHSGVNRRVVLCALVACLAPIEAAAQADCRQVEDHLQKRQLEAAAAQTLQPGTGICAHAVAKAFLRTGNRDRAQELINRAARFADPLLQPELTAEILVARIELEAAPEILREDLDQLKRLAPEKREELIGRLGNPVNAAINGYLKSPLRGRCPSREIKSAWASYHGHQPDRLEQVCAMTAELQRFRSVGATSADEVGAAAAELGRLRALMAEAGTPLGADAAPIEARIAAWRDYFGKVERAGRETEPSRKLASWREAVQISQRRLDAKDPADAARQVAELAGRADVPAHAVEEADKDPKPPAPAAGPVPALLASAPAGRMLALLPTDSARDLELQIAQYLRSRTTWNIEVMSKANKPDDVYLSLLFAADGIPSFRITVDTFVGERDKATNKPVEQVIKIQGYAFEAKSRRILNRARFYEFANKWTAYVWIPQRMYADAEGDLILEWHMNLTPDGGVPPDQIHDAIVKLSEVWRDLVPQLRKASLIP